jgi:hypothetical protein
MEFQREMKKKQKTEQSLESTRKSFRLKQKPEYQSPFAAMKDEQKKAEEYLKLKELQEKFWADTGVNG